MTISELISVLLDRKKAHGDRDVAVTYEGITAENLEASSVYLAKDGNLYIDADSNFYKDKFAVDPYEGGRCRLYGETQ